VCILDVLDIELVQWLCVIIIFVILIYSVYQKITKPFYGVYLHRRNGERLGAKVTASKFDKKKTRHKLSKIYHKKFL
jgi:hypothetical protein